MVSNLSLWVAVTSGGPQGSIFGPLLFIMYVNDLPKKIQYSKCFMFADDAKIFKSISCLQDCINLQFDLNALVEWCTFWKLDLNLNKCFVMIFFVKMSPQYCLFI